MAVAACVDALQQRSDQFGGRRRLLVGVGDAEAATEVEVMQTQAGGLDRLDQRAALALVERGERLRPALARPRWRLLPRQARPLP